MTAKPAVDAAVRLADERQPRTRPFPAASGSGIELPSQTPSIGSPKAAEFGPGELQTCPRPHPIGRAPARSQAL